MVISDKLGAARGITTVRGGGITYFADRIGVPREFSRQLVSEGLVSISYQKGREKNVHNLFRLLNYNCQTHSPAYEREGMVFFESNRLTGFAKRVSADTSGVTISATEAFIGGHSGLLLYSGAVDVVSIPNPQPRSFRIPSSLGGDSFIVKSEEEADLTSNRICAAVHAAIRKETFLPDVDMTRNYAFSAGCIYFGSLNGWIMDPANVLLRVTAIRQGDKIHLSGSLGDDVHKYPGLGYYYFDINGNGAPIKVTDPDDLELLNNPCLAQLSDRHIYNYTEPGGELRIACRVL